MKTFFVRAFALIIFLWILSHISSWYKLVDKVKVTSCQEKFIDTTWNNDSVRIQTRNWNASSHNYCSQFQIAKEDYVQSSSDKRAFDLKRGGSYHQVWGSLYKELYESNHQQVESLKDSLLIIKSTLALDHNEFAYTVVKFIQDIPYAYIESDTCNDVKDKPCLGKQKFGITSPVEFMYTLKGDCDSRTVILYSLLRDFGYKPLILISREYLHSMLALDIQSAGEYVFHNGRKFYFWETTGKGWEPGIIPPGMGNKEYWNIALDYE